MYGLDVMYRFVISRNLEGFFAKQPNSRQRDTSAVGCGEERKGGEVLRNLMGQCVAGREHVILFLSLNTDEEYNLFFLTGSIPLFLPWLENDFWL
jgi:hypothetical protein